MVARLANDDARIAIETLRRAALIAEDREEERITADHVKKAFGTTHTLRREDALKRLNEHEHALYALLEKHKKLGTAELWEKYLKAVKEPASQRSYRNYMAHLIRLGLVRGSGELTGRVYECRA